jgi:hypothetical protein
MPNLSIAEIVSCERIHGYLQGTSRPNKRTGDIQWHMARGRKEERWEGVVDAFKYDKAGCGAEKERGQPQPCP